MFTKIKNFTFLLLVFSLPFVSIAYVWYSQQKILITEFVFLAAGVLILLNFAVRKELPKFEKFYFPLIGYGVALVLSTIFSETPSSSVVKLVGEFYLIGLAVLTFVWISETNDFRKVVLVWTAASFIVSLVSIVTLFLFYFDRTNLLVNLTLSKYGTLPVGNYPRIKSLFLNPNMFCHYLTISWVFLLASLKLGYIRKWMFFVTAPVFTVATMFTISPGIGGVMLVIGLWFYFNFAEREKKTFARVSLAAGIIGAALFFVSTVGFPTAFVKNAGVSAGTVEFEPSVRLIAWKNSINTILKDPIFGKGLNTDIAHTAYSLPSGENIYLTDSHQMWLNVMGQAGIFGLLALLYIAYFLLKDSGPFGFRSERDIIRTSLAIAFISTFIYQGLFGSYENARHLWVLIGLLAWSVKIRNNTEDS